MDTRRKRVIKSSVTSSIRKLIAQAQKAYREGKPERSARYVKMALDLIKKQKVKLPKELKNSFCKKCDVVWLPGKTVKVVYDKKNHCLRINCQCGNSKRI